VKANLCFGGRCRFYLQARKVSQPRNQHESQQKYNIKVKPSLHFGKESRNMRKGARKIRETSVAEFSQVIPGAI
jgi:hypothetical protein